VAVGGASGPKGAEFAGLAGLGQRDCRRSAQPDTPCKELPLLSQFMQRTQIQVPDATGRGL
jgi:hypothetical protein